MLSGCDGIELLTFEDFCLLIGLLDELALPSPVAEMDLLLDCLAPGLTILLFWLDWGLDCYFDSSEYFCLIF
jgi:hypothetical protein